MTEDVANVPYGYINMFTDGSESINWIAQFGRRLTFLSGSFGARRWGRYFSTKGLIDQARREPLQNNEKPLRSARIAAAGIPPNGGQDLISSHFRAIHRH
mgnify:CR=1 FL=1